MNKLVPQKQDTEYYDDDTLVGILDASANVRKLLNNLTIEELWEIVTLIHDADYYLEFGSEFSTKHIASGLKALQTTSLIKLQVQPNYSYDTDDDITKPTYNNYKLLAQKIVNSNKEEYEANGFVGGGNTIGLAKQGKVFTLDG